MIYETTCNGAEITVHFSTTITYKGYKGRSAHFDSPGEPEEPMEYEIEITSVVDEHGDDVELSTLDRDHLIIKMIDSSEVYEMIKEELEQ